MIKIKKHQIEDYISDATEIAKQNTLVSTVNIKSINGNSILGSGNLTISGGGGGSGILNGIASGTDTYTATIGGVTSYTDGDAFLIRFTNGNTTTCTLNVNGLGAIPLYRNNDGALIGGDIQVNGEMLCVYDYALSVFKCIGTSPNSIIAYVTNADSVTITKGQAVYAFGGQGDRMTVKLASNIGDSTSAQTVGIVMSTSIATNQKGFIMTIGMLDGLSTLPTSTFADGDTLYLGATAGTITNVKPYAPNHLVYLGVVTTASAGAAGRMYVKPQNGYLLDEIHNVQAQNPTLKDTLWFDNTVSPAQWKTASIATILGYTPANDSNTVHKTGAETIAGIKTFSSNIAIPATGTPLILSVSSGGTVSGLTTTIYPNLTELTYLKNVTSAIQTQINSKQDTLSSGNNIKTINGNTLLGTGNLTISASAASQNAYTMLANNTASSAVPTEKAFQNFGEQTYTPTPAWTGTTAPSGTTAHSYSWSQIGNMVIIRLNLSYTVAGSSLTSVVCVLPSDLPTPLLPTSVTTNLDTISYGSGTLSTTKASLATPIATYASLRLKTIGTPNIFEIVIARATGSFQYAYALIQYFV